MKTRNSHGLLHLGREALAYCQCASALISGNKALFVSVDLIGEKNQVILELSISCMLTSQRFFFQPVDEYEFKGIVYSHHMSPVATKHSLVAVGCHSSSLKLVDLKSGSASHTLKGHQSSILCVKWSTRDEFLLASGRYICITVKLLWSFDRHQSDRIPAFVRQNKILSDQIDFIVRFGKKCFVGPLVLHSRYFFYIH